MGGMNTPTETFRQEVEELLADIEEAVLDIEQNSGDKETVDRLFRAMHTIKGSGGMFGMDEMSAFTHHVETALDLVRERKLAVTRELIDLILASRDQIQTMLAADDGSPTDREAAESIVDRLKVLMSDQNQADGPGALAADTEPESSGEVTYRIRFRPDPAVFSSGMDPALLLDELAELGPMAVVCQTEDIPAFSEMDPERCYLWWDVVLTTSDGMSAVKDVFIFVEDDSEIEITEIADTATVDPDAAPPRFGEILVDRGDVSREELQAALEEQSRLGDILVKKGVVSDEKVESALREQEALRERKQVAKAESVRVPADKLDRLVNLVGELVITRAQLSQVVAGIDRVDLETPVEDVDRLTGELRDLVLNIRMMPIGATFTRFRRLVRDLSAELGKEIKLITEGAETEMDKTVVDRLGDPLVHLIRNSIDHGIEGPEERLAAGKPRAGAITLKAAHKGANVVVTVSDDGKGLDRETIRAKAVARGLVSADADLSDKEVFDQIFAPGFSTAAQVSNVSGRGVGMDVVKREIDNLRGSVEVESRPGEGSTMNLSLPLTLAIVDGLLVRVATELYVIPLSLVERCLELADSAFALSKRRNVVSVRGELLPCVRLRDYFALAGRPPEIEEAVVVSVGEDRLVLSVDHVIGDHQTVIKSLGKAYEDVEGVSGGTIMGDGTVALIVDVPGMLRRVRQDEREAVCGP